MRSRSISHILHLGGACTGVAGLEQCWGERAELPEETERRAESEQREKGYMELILCYG